MRDLLRETGEVFRVIILLFGPLLLMAFAIVVLIAWGES